jgi:hypothetical protein
MIQLTRPALSVKTSKKLQQYQTSVDTQTGFPAQVAFAKDDFPLKNVVGNTTFDNVKEKLIEMCSGAERCHYCEDSKADEVEHLLPKDVYPDYCYQWTNYLYSCGPCNVKKSNKCAIINPANQQLVNNQPPKRKKNGPPVPPPNPPVAGQQAFIDLATENPLDFFLLDLQTGSFEFAELPDPTSTDYLRANFTLEALELNKRAFLRKARKEAYGSYKARLTVYIHDKKNGTPQTQLNVMIDEIKTHSHPTVWKEMIRQRDYIVELQDLFNEAPEALEW